MGWNIWAFFVGKVSLLGGYRMNIIPLSHKYKDGFIQY